MGRKAWRFGTLAAMQKKGVDMQHFQYLLRTGRLRDDYKIMLKLKANRMDGDSRSRR